MSDKSQSRTQRLPIMAYILVVGIAVMMFFGRASPTFTGLSVAAAKTLFVVITMGGFTIALIYAKERWIYGD